MKQINWYLFCFNKHVHWFDKTSAIFPFSSAHIFVGTFYLQQVRFVNNNIIIVFRKNEPVFRVRGMQAAVHARYECWQKTACIICSAQKNFWQYVVSLELCQISSSQNKFEPYTSIIRYSYRAYHTFSKYIGVWNKKKCFIDCTVQDRKFSKTSLKYETNFRYSPIDLIQKRHF
jgi:hypothetical protein